MTKPQTTPKSPGYYWAKWRIASDGTHEGDELTPSNTWEIVQVNDNNGEPGSNTELSVAVPGVRETQWPDQFVWGDRVADLAGATASAAPANPPISLQDPLVILAGIQQFGLAADGSDLRDLQAALVRTLPAAETTAPETTPANLPKPVQDAILVLQEHYDLRRSVLLTAIAKAQQQS